MMDNIELWKNVRPDYNTWRCLYLNSPEWYTIFNTDNTRARRAGQTFIVNNIDCLGSGVRATLCEAGDLADAWVTVTCNVLVIQKGGDQPWGFTQFYQPS